MNQFILLLSRRELMLIGAAIPILVVAAIVTFLISRKKEKELTELSEDVDMIWDLWYRQLEREADAKYKAYTTRGYADRLPEKTEAIPEDRELQQRLLKATSKQQRKALLSEYLPEIMFPLVVCKYEGFDDLSQKDAVKLKQLMNDYGVKPLKRNSAKGKAQQQ